MATIIDGKVCGIPCQFQVNYFHQQKPLGKWCDSDQDAVGYVELDFDILDRRGRKADWLVAKMEKMNQRDMVEESIIKELTH